MGDSADKSTREIKHLLIKLNPNDDGGHNSRVKAMDRFKQYVSGASNKRGKGSTPPFYDDDITFLYLGVKSEIDEDEEEEDSYLDGDYYGLLAACGTPSTDYTDGLKRSARNAMILLKYLVCDFVEMSNGKPTPVKKPKDENDIDDLNQFAQRFCVLTVEQLKALKLDVHVKSSQYNSTEGNKRNGAKEEACHLLVLLLTRHMNTDGTVRQPILASDLLPSEAAMKGFEAWLKQNTSSEVKDQIMSMLYTPVNNNASSNSSSDKTNKSPTKAKPQQKKVVLNPFDDDEDEQEDEDDDENKEKEDTFPDSSSHRSNKSKNRRMQSEEKLWDNEKYTEGPTTWAESDLAHPSTATDLTVNRFHYSRFDSNMDTSGQRMISRKLRELDDDPLGIRPKAFNINQVNETKKTILEDIIRDLEQEKKEIEDQYDHHIKHEEIEFASTIEEQLLVLEKELEHLMKLYQGDGKNASNKKNTERNNNSDSDMSRDESKNKIQESSILATDPNFDPLLFLTLIHADVTPEQLRDGLYRLNGMNIYVYIYIVFIYFYHHDCYVLIVLIFVEKKAEQARKSQSIIKDKIDLFVQCAKGINIYTEDLTNPINNKSPVAIRERIDSCDILAATCSDISLRSFYTLLDNTKQVQKVQATLAVLQRIGPLLQVPTSMKHDIENGRFSSAIKSYRQTLAINDNEKMDLLRLIKTKATSIAQNVRQQLESRIADPNTTVPALLEAIRDLSELVEVSLPIEKDAGIKLVPLEKSGFKYLSPGKFMLDLITVDIRSHSPSISCYLLQATLFASLAQNAVTQIEDDIVRVFHGESFSAVTGMALPSDYYDSTPSDESPKAKSTNDDEKVRNRLKDAIVELRVLATNRAVSILRLWLPRLADLAEGVREFEKRQYALTTRRKRMDDQTPSSTLTALEIYYTHIAPCISMMVDQITFMAVGSKDGKDSIGLGRDGRLPGVLRNPLPPLKSSKCALELASLFEILTSTWSSSVKPSGRIFQLVGVTENSDGFVMESALMKDCIEKSRSSLIEMERRHCKHTFDTCARNIKIKASGNGLIDGNVIISCLSKLLQDLTVPVECCNEIIEGVIDIIDQCCFGLLDYVAGSNRDDVALLRAINSCASMLSDKIIGINREVVLLLTSDSAGAYDKAVSLEKTITEKISQCEAELFDGFLDNIRQSLAYYTKLGPLDVSSFDDDEMSQDYMRKEGTFPSYLSSSLLAIVRYRAMVEKELSPNMIRKADNESYQHVTLYTASDSLVLGFCKELRSRFPRMSGHHADRHVNELLFLLQTLRKFLSENVLLETEECRRILVNKAGGSFQGTGPDGLGTIERLERLGRIYVICLSGGNEKYEL